VTDFPSRVQIFAGKRFAQNGGREYYFCATACFSKGVILITRLSACFTEISERQAQDPSFLQLLHSFSIAKYWAFFPRGIRRP